METQEEISFKQVLDALLDLDKPFSPSYLNRFSDLCSDDLAELQETWPNVPALRRQAVMEDIEELGEINYTLSFETIAWYCIKDREPGVREIAVRTLWEYDSPDLVPILLDMVERDDNPGVRAVAASALGKYVYLGEIEELPEQSLRSIEEKLLKVNSSSDTTLVRRRALESLGFSSLEKVSPLIENAYYSGKVDWIVSALFAMGHTANRAWHQLVLQMLDSDNPQIRAEASRAAGELEIHEAVPRLIELLEDSDMDVRIATIWSLSQIGGEGVQDELELMYDDTDDEEETQLIEVALDNLAFTNDLQLFSLMDIAEGEDDGENFDFPEDIEGFLN